MDKLLDKAVDLLNENQRLNGLLRQAEAECNEARASLDASQTDVARLREALGRIANATDDFIPAANFRRVAKEALAATDPTQHSSLRSDLG